MTTHEDLSIKMVEMSTDYDGLKGESCGPEFDKVMVTSKSQLMHIFF